MVKSFWKTPKIRKIKVNSNPFGKTKPKMTPFGLKVPFTPKRKKDMNWTQAKSRFPHLKPLGDIDKDGVKNKFDCKPFDKKRQGWAHQGTVFPRERTTHVVMMNPEKFLRTTYKETQGKSSGGRGIFPRGEEDVKIQSYEDYSRDVIDKKNVEKLKKVIRSRKGKMQVPFLEYDEQGRPIGHEGRHRAKAAEELGIKKIPVTIARRLKGKDLRDWKSQRERYGAKKDWKKELESEDEVVSSESADVPIQEQREYGEEKPESLKRLSKEDKEIEEELDKMEEDE